MSFCFSLGKYPKSRLQSIQKNPDPPLSIAKEPYLRLDNTFSHILFKIASP